MRSHLNHPKTGRRYLNFLFLIACICSNATFVSAAEPATILVSDKSLQKNLRLFVGPQVSVELCDLTEQMLLLGSGVDATKVIVFARRGQVDPIVEERAKNSGLRVIYLDVPSKNSGDVPTCRVLRNLFEALNRCYPERKAEFRARLDQAEYKILQRYRARLIAQRVVLDQT